MCTIIDIFEEFEGVYQLFFWYLNRQTKDINQRKEIAQNEFGHWFNYVENRKNDLTEVMD